MRIAFNIFRPHHTQGHHRLPPNQPEASIPKHTICSKTRLPESRTHREGEPFAAKASTKGPVVAGPEAQWFPDPRREGVSKHVPKGRAPRRSRNRHSSLVRELVYCPFAISKRVGVGATVGVSETPSVYACGSFPQTVRFVGADRLKSFPSRP